MNGILKVEIEDELLKITDLNGYEYRYRQDDKGVLHLGYPYMVIWEEYVVRLFLPVPEGIPTVLSIKVVDIPPAM
jgi:hypothetical protein